MSAEQVFGKVALVVVDGQRGVAAGKIAVVPRTADYVCQNKLVG